MNERATPQGHAKAIARLSELLGDRLSTAAVILEHHGQNETLYPVTPPDAVAFPQSTAEVQAIMRICWDEGCPVIPWGIGTSLEGHALPFQGGITLDMSQMNQVLAIHAEDMDVTVQPGVTREQLNEDLRATGLFFPVDPGANATLGGMTATGASGTTAVRYGTMRNNVLALEAVLADGRVIRTGTRARKSSSGYDLTRLLVGSEGTLAVLTEITLRLHGQPEAVSAATCAFPDVESAVNCVMTVIQSGVPMARIEFIDEFLIEGFNKYHKTDIPAKPHLFMEFHGSPASVREQSETVGMIAEDFGGEEFKWSDREEERKALWKMRHEGFYALKSLRPGADVLTTDTCVPISRLAEAVTAARADLDANGLMASVIGHVGDGNFHATIMFDPDDDETLKLAKACAHRMVLHALELGGTATGEHGIGRGKMGYMAEEHGDAWSVMGDIKRTLDPRNILNPGKVVQIN